MKGRELQQFNERKKEVFILKEQFSRVFFNKSGRLLDLLKTKTRSEINKILDIFNEVLVEDWETDNYQSFQENITKENIDFLTESFKFILNAILTSPAYLRAKKAYNNQLLRSLSNEEEHQLHYFLDKYYFNKAFQSNNFYHGIQVFVKEDTIKLNKEFLIKDPVHYIDIVQKIYNQGLKANTAFENFPGLESVFCAQSPKYTYGIIGLIVKGNEDDIYWQHSNGSAEGIQFVKPMLKKDFIVYIKSLNYLLDTSSDKNSTSNFIINKLDLDKYDSYINELIQELHKKNIQFIIL